MKRSIQNFVENGRKAITSKRDLSADEIIEIINRSESLSKGSFAYNLISDSFYCGVYAGIQQERAGRKKARKSKPEMLCSLFEGSTSAELERMHNLITAYLNASPEAIERITRALQEA